MLVADAAIFIDQQKRRHTPEFKEIPLLSITVCHAVLGIRQTDKRDAFALPITQESFGAIRPNRQDDCVTRSEVRVLIAQTREMSATIRSHKTAQKGKHDRLAAKIR